MKLVLKNFIKGAKGSLNNIFQDSFDKILSQQLTYISYISSSYLPFYRVFTIVVSRYRHHNVAVSSSLFHYFILIIIIVLSCSCFKLTLFKGYSADSVSLYIRQKIDRICHELTVEIKFY